MTSIANVSNCKALVMQCAGSCCQHDVTRAVLLAEESVYGAPVAVTQTAACSHAYPAAQDAPA